jgi:hypothetical protein
MSRARAALVASSFALAACSGVDESVSPACVPSPDAPPAASSPRLERTWQIATHNAYWVNHGVGDPFASGTQERFVDQIAVDAVRSVEIDVHRDDARPHRFRVYHTNPGNSLCDSLDTCLGNLSAIDAALPSREVLTIVVELKEITASNFDRDHTILDLDATFVRSFGDRLVRPRDVLDRCTSAGLCPTSLSDCVAMLGFPTVDELRGKVIVAVLGNWDAIGAQATKDWVDYATSGDLTDRACFPMSSSWQLDLDAVPPLVSRLLTQDDLDRAAAASAFMQVEDTRDPRLAPFLKRRGVVRIDGANAVADQRARLALGAELLQTDTPWVRAGGVDVARPLEALGGAAMLPESGVRFALDAASDGAPVFAAARDATRSSRLEALVGAGASGQASGCLRAADDEAGATSFTVCRGKIAADRSAGAAGSPDAEQAVITVTSCKAGACTTTSRSSRADAAVGDFVALDLAPHGASGVCAKAETAATAAADLTLAWKAAGDAACFDSTLALRGIARVDLTGEPPARVWFFGLARDGAPFVAADFTTVVAAPASGALRPARALLVDASTPPSP